jgi:hypothetical protein
MRIGIFELAPRGHPPLVEAVTAIYASQPEHQIWIVTHEQGKSDVAFLTSDQVKLFVKPNFENYPQFFDRVKQLNLDIIYLITFEAFSKENYEVIVGFCKQTFNIPICLFIHNIDFWFQQRLTHKIANMLHDLKRFSELPYRLKLQFLYPSKNTTLLQKVHQTGGHLIVLSESVAHELKNYVDAQKIQVIPFAIYDSKIQDTSQHNQRIRICIPGMISATRRDYDSIFKLLEQNEDSLKKHIELELLGAYNTKEGGEAIKLKVDALKEKGFRIESYDAWLDMDFYNQQLAKADIILGNMHLQQGRLGKYGKTKETGILFTMIKAAKPGFLPTGYAYDDALKSGVVEFETYEHIAQTLLVWLNDLKSLHQLKKNAQQNALYYHPKLVYQRINALKA